jgi:hypothetical protein
MVNVVRVVVIFQILVISEYSGGKWGTEEEVAVVSKAPE